jgi:hypothetical protein
LFVVHGGERWLLTDRDIKRLNAIGEEYINEDIWTGGRTGNMDNMI